MRILIWTFRLILFLALLAFAVRNTEPVTLRFYFDLAWQAPLVAVLLAALAVGAALGVFAALGVLLRQRRQIQLLSRPAPPAPGDPVDAGEPRDPNDASGATQAALPPRAVDG